jgi:phage-related protein
MGYISYNEKGRYDTGLRKFEIEFYKMIDGTCPVKEFMDSLDNKMRAKLLRTVCLLEQNGNELRDPYSKHLEDGIFELRVKQGSDITRTLYFFVTGHKIILTNGFVKKEQKTPRSELNLAKKYRDDFLNRKEHLL